MPYLALKFPHSVASCSCLALRVHQTASASCGISTLTTSPSVSFVSVPAPLFLRLGQQNLCKTWGPVCLVVFSGRGGVLLAFDGRIGTMLCNASPKSLWSWNKQPRMQAIRLNKLGEKCPRGKEERVEGEEKQAHLSILWASDLGNPKNGRILPLWGGPRKCPRIGPTVQATPGFRDRWDLPSLSNHR